MNDKPSAEADQTQCAPAPRRPEAEVEDCANAALSSSPKASNIMQTCTETFIAAEAVGPTWERRSPRPEDDHVLGHTQNWLNALPKGVRPVQLPAAFPRIVNELCSLWEESAALDRYFEDKEFSTRDDRKGFPPLIKEELLAMHVYSLRNRVGNHEERVPQRAALLGT